MIGTLDRTICWNRVKNEWVPLWMADEIMHNRGPSWIGHCIDKGTLVKVTSNPDFLPEDPPHHKYEIDTGHRGGPFWFNKEAFEFVGFIKFRIGRRRKHDKEYQEYPV